MIFTEAEKASIRLVISGNITEANLDGLTPHQVVEYLESLGFTRGEIETNGWQVDFWIPFTNRKVKLMFSGSMYYGGYKLSLDED